MSNLKLIREDIDYSSVSYLTEGKGPEKRHYIQGPFLQAEITNKNNRIYPLRILEAEVNRYQTENINTGSSYGELGHPEGPQINLDRVSHIIKELKQDGNNFIGKALISSTPCGKIAAGLLEDGGRLGVSSRGLGSLSQRGPVHFVNEDYRIATAADIVADPSAPDAFVNGIMEGKEYIWDNGILKECTISGYRKEIEKAVFTRDKQQRFIELFEDFLRKI